MRLVVRLYRKFASWFVYQKIKRYVITADNVIFSHHFSCKCDNFKSIKVGNNSTIDGFWVTQGNGNIQVGMYCSFRRGTYVGAVSSIIIGDNVYGAENVFIIDNNNHPISPKARKEMTESPPNSPLWKWKNKEVVSAKVIIGNNVWLGRNCMILKGVTIGDGSIVAAGAVVTRSVPEFTIVAGNPAKPVKSIVNDL